MQNRLFRKRSVLGILVLFIVGLIMISFTSIYINRVKADDPITSTFGYTTEGTSMPNIESRIVGVWGGATGGDGVADYIMARFSVVDGDGDYVGHATAGLYTYVDCDPVFAGGLLAQTGVEEITVLEGSTVWVRFNFTGERPSILNNTRYYCVVSAENAAGNLKLMATRESGYGMYEIVAFSDVLPDPLEGEIGSGYRRCIYCSYTVVSENTAPVLSDEYPSNGSTGVNLNPTLSVDVEDVDEEPLTVIFRSNASGSWDVLGEHIGENGEYTQTTTNMDTLNTIYYWSVHVSDTKIWTNATYHFTTAGSNIPTLKWSKSDAFGWSAVNPLIADVNADGRIEVIRSGTDGIMVFDGDTGDVVWTKPMAMWNDHCPMEIIDLNKDGILEIICSYETGTMAIHGNNGSVYWYNPDAPLLNKYAVVGDIDADGYPEVFVTNMGSITALTHDGQIFATTYTYYPCFGGLTLGDTDQDGVFELYIGDRHIGWGGEGVRAFWASNLTNRWNHDTTYCSSLCPTLVDVDKDGKLDVVALQQIGGGIVVLNSTDGSIIHEKNNILGMLCHSQPTIHDIDGDGNLELIACWDSKPLIWDLYEWRKEQAEGLDYYGRLPYVCREPPAVADITGDGNVEILAYTYNNITIFNNEYEILGTFAVGGTHYGSAFIIAQDVDDDDLTELIYNRAASVYVYDTVAPAPEPRALTQFNFYSQHRGRSPYYTAYGPLTPIVKNENPTDESTDQSINPTLSVYIYDYQHDSMNITFRTNASGTWQDIMSYINVQDGTYTTTTVNMDSIDTTYWWSVEVTDSTGKSTNKLYKFTTTITKPILSNPSPTNGDVDIELEPVLSIDAVCYQGSAMNILFRTNASGTWETIGSNLNVYNGTFYCNNTNDINNYDTWYWWSVNATDLGSGNWTNETYSFTTRSAYSGWWNGDWMYRKEIVIDHTKVASDLLNFPVLVRLDSDSSIAVHAQSDGDDIVFIDYAGNKLNHEIELYDGSIGQLIAWVNVTSLSSTSDMILYLYYGNNLCGSQENVEDTWDSDYLAVHHFRETSGQHQDSTSNNNDSTVVSVSTQGASGGVVGKCDVLDGLDDFIQFPNKKFAAGKDEITVEVWINPDEYGSSDTIYDEWNANYYWQYSLRFDDFYTRDASGGPTESRDNDLAWSTSPEVGSWHHVASWYSVSTGQKRIYLDGSIDAYTTTNIGTLTSDRDVDSPRLGYACDGDNFDGKVDEFRVSKVARSTEWLNTTYSTINFPYEFLSVGEEESEPEPDEFEDFTTWTAVGSNISVEKHKITSTNLPGNVETRVKKNYSTIDFTHEFEIHLEETEVDSRLVFWQIVNDASHNTYQECLDNSDGVAFYYYQNSQKRVLFFKVYDAENPHSATSWEMSPDYDTYYIRITKTGDVLVAEIYTDSNRLNLVAILTRQSPAGLAYNYLFGMASWGSSWCTKETSGYTANLKML